ncbi:hypothetical protein K525DRAFT_274977 [Schizophyllum commune Loenen D]|nr:hypothetical protein K525DRAFT_274977 [Schizophyllum commune Loenen D]
MLTVDQVPDLGRGMMHKLRKGLLSTFNGAREVGVRDIRCRPSTPSTTTRPTFNTLGDVHATPSPNLTRVTKAEGIGLVSVSDSKSACKIVARIVLNAGNMSFCIVLTSTTGGGTNSSICDLAYKPCIKSPAESAHATRNSSFASSISRSRATVLACSLFPSYFDVVPTLPRFAGHNRALPVNALKRAGPAPIVDNTLRNALDDAPDALNVVALLDALNAPVAPFPLRAGVLIERRVCGSPSTTHLTPSASPSSLPVSRSLQVCYYVAHGKYAASAATSRAVLRGCTAQSFGDDPGQLPPSSKAWATASDSYPYPTLTVIDGDAAATHHQVVRRSGGLFENSRPTSLTVGLLVVGTIIVAGLLAGLAFYIARRRQRTSEGGEDTMSSFIQMDGGSGSSSSTSHLQPRSSQYLPRPPSISSLSGFLPPQFLPPSAMQQQQFLPPPALQQQLPPGLQQQQISPPPPHSVPPQPQSKPKAKVKAREASMYTLPSGITLSHRIPDANGERTPECDFQTVVHDIDNLQLPQLKELVKLLDLKAAPDGAKARPKKDDFAKALQNFSAEKLGGQAVWKHKYEPVNTRSHKGPVNP